MSEAMVWTCRFVAVGEIRLVRNTVYFGYGGFDVAQFETWEDACATASALSAGYSVGFCDSGGWGRQYLNADGTVTLKPKGTERLNYEELYARLLIHATPAEEPTPIEPNVGESSGDAKNLSEAMFWTCKPDRDDYLLVYATSYYGAPPRTDVARFTTCENGDKTVRVLASGHSVGFCRTGGHLAFLNPDCTVTAVPKEIEEIRWYPFSASLLLPCEKEPKPAVDVEPKVVGVCDCYGNENGCPQKRQADYYEKLYHDTRSTLKRTRKMVRALMALLPDELKGKSESVLETTTSGRWHHAPCALTRTSKTAIGQFQTLERKPHE